MVVDCFAALGTDYLTVEYLVYFLKVHQSAVFKEFERHCLRLLDIGEFFAEHVDEPVL